GFFFSDRTLNVGFILQRARAGSDTLAAVSELFGADQLVVLSLLDALPISKIVINRGGADRGAVGFIALGEVGFFFSDRTLKVGFILQRARAGSDILAAVSELFGADQLVVDAGIGGALIAKIVINRGGADRG